MHIMRPEGGYTDGLLDLIGYIKARRLPGQWSMVEIGVHIGESTSMFLDGLFPDRLYAVDFWHGGYDQFDKLSNFYGDDYEAIFDARMRKHPNVIKLKGESRLMAPAIPDFSVDFVYIDACHTYEAVKSDIELYRPKIRRPGMIGGHDYLDQAFNGIKRAVDGAFGAPYKTFADGSWLVNLT